MIRIVREEDTEQLRELYAYYVENTAITFEYEVPSVEEFRNRICRTVQRYPYLVSECGGVINGYAYAGVFHERSAYDWAVETSIYVAENAVKKGIGKELYMSLEQALALQHIINLNACIAYPVREDPYLTKNSVQFHEHMGYRLVGQFHKCGYKFGRWYDMVWMEKCISHHPEHPQAVRSFDEIRNELHQTEIYD